MIEAVIWDFGGVLTSSPFEAFARFEAERGLPADIIRRTNADNHLENAWAKFERAEVDADTFDALFAAESLALGAEGVWCGSVWLCSEEDVANQAIKAKFLAAARGITSIEVKDDKIMLTREGEYIQVGHKFPRLTKKEPVGKLKEIRKLLLAL